MDEPNAGAAEGGGDAPMTREQWRALAAAWLGWAFDGLDGYLYVMVAGEFVTQLLKNEYGEQPLPDGLVVSRAALIQAMFLVGWAVGGAIFGRIGDRMGRARTLTLTILTYAVFTGLAFFATRWWHLLIFRFFAALGIGGEWAAGSALVSETLPARHRAWASAVLQSGYILGCTAAIVVAGVLPREKPHWVFVIGVLPAFLTVWIRGAVPEPKEWTEACRGPMPRVADLFRGGLARTTSMLLVLTSIALTTVWAFLFFVPQAIVQVATQSKMTLDQASALKTNVTLVFFLVNIVANFFATYLAKVAGYRAAFFIMMLGAAISTLVGFRAPPSVGSLYVLTSLVAFFGLGLFGMFPLYIPPLFPTLLRTLGAGFTYNIGRLVAAGGTLGAGWLAAEAGGASGAIWWTGFLYIPGLLVATMIPVGAAAVRSKR